MMFNTLAYTCVLAFSYIPTVKIKIPEAMFYQLIIYIQAYSLKYNEIVHELMWRLWGFHLILLSDNFHLNFSFPDPPKKYKKSPRTLHYYVGIIIYG